jgi:prolyl oligopeptidase
VSWFKAQAQLTDGIINTIHGRDELLAEWGQQENLKPCSFFNLSTCNEVTFYQKKEPTEAYAKLYYKKKGSNAEELLFNPKSDLFHSAIPSYDGNHIILTFTKNGSEVFWLKVFDVKTKTLLPDSIYPATGNVYWCHNNKSFIHTQLVTDDNNSSDFFKNNKVKLHTIGTKQETDVDYFSVKAYPELNIDLEKSPNGEISAYAPNYLFTSIGNDDGLCVYYVAHTNQEYAKHINWKVLCKAEDELTNYIDFRENKAYAVCKKNAKNYKLISTDIENPKWNNPEIIAEEKNDLVLDYFTFCKDYILITYSDGINSKLFKYNMLTKQTSEINLPFNGKINISCINKSKNDAMVTITSWNKPITEFELDVTTNKFVLSNFNKTPDYPENLKNIRVEEIEVKSYDEQLIPLTLLYKADFKKDGNSICFMDSYGAYGFSMNPSFSIKRNSLIERGVIVAIPHVRGGGEKGEAWYKGGYKTTKQNTWKDFNSCAEYLINNKYTAVKKIIAHSGSAGGILISRAIIEKPNLYGTAIIGSGLINTLRMEQMPNGANLTGEFGTTKDSLESKMLFEMDGIAHLKNNIDYPAVICFTGWNDPRVASWQSAKFIAALQSITTSTTLKLLQVKYDGGHFPTSKVYADYFSFALWQCGHPYFYKKK